MMEICKDSWHHHKTHKCKNIEFSLLVLYFFTKTKTRHEMYRIDMYTVAEI